MNIESPNISKTNSTRNTSQSRNSQNTSVKFSDELKELKKTEKEEVKEESAAEEITDNKELTKTENVNESEEADEEQTSEVKPEKDTEEEIKEEESLKDTSTLPEDENTESREEDLNKAFDGLNSIVQELNKKVDQTEDITSPPLKEEVLPSDNKPKEDNTLINNDFNIQDNKDLLPQMNPNMNFSGDGQPFSSFMNNSPQNNPNQNLSMSEKDLAEEAAILSTMAENMALANKNKIMSETPVKTKTVERNDGVKKVNKQTGITVENVVKYDSVIMNQADVEVFANLVENGEADMTKLAPQAAQKSIHVSKTLADMLAKAMEKNQPVRIDFDNNISVIIRISRDGKISADFLPSSQVAEVYLKENLPLLRQRFDDNNIEYDELNQRNSREQERQNKKKERDNE